VVAGGHSLLPMMKLRLARPDCLVDINDLYELDFLLEDAGTLRIGALTRHTTLLEVRARRPAVPDRPRRRAGDRRPVVRNRGTIGGSLCQADPAEDLSTVCDVLRARRSSAAPPASARSPWAELHRGPYETAVARTSC
jgi:carbon-monoxide dehydrogenase medium subunit